MVAMVQRERRRLAETGCVYAARVRIAGMRRLKRRDGSFGGDVRRGVVPESGRPIVVEALSSASASDWMGRSRHNGRN